MNTKTKQNVSVGVDTGKFQLDIYIRPLDIYFTVNNDEKGIKEAVRTIKKYSPERSVIEATGRLEMPFILACASANLLLCYCESYPRKTLCRSVRPASKN